MGGVTTTKRSAWFSLPMNRSAAVCGRGGTSHSGPTISCALRLVEDDTAALRSGAQIAAFRGPWNLSPRRGEGQ